MEWILGQADAPDLTWIAGLVGVVFGTVLTILGTWWLETRRNKYELSREKIRLEAQDRRRFQDTELDLFADFIGACDRLMTHFDTMFDSLDESNDERFRKEIKETPAHLERDALIAAFSDQRAAYNRIILVVDERVAAVAWNMVLATEHAAQSVFLLAGRADPGLVDGIPVSIRERGPNGEDLAHGGGWHRSFYRRLRSTFRKAARHELGISDGPFDIEKELAWMENADTGQNVASIWLEPGLI